MKIRAVAVAGVVVYAELAPARLALRAESDRRPRLSFEVVHPGLKHVHRVFVRSLIAHAPPPFRSICSSWSSALTPAPWGGPPARPALGTRRGPLGRAESPSRPPARFRGARSAVDRGGRAPRSGRRTRGARQDGGRAGPNRSCRRPSAHR